MDTILTCFFTKEPSRRICAHTPDGKGAVWETRGGLRGKGMRSCIILKLNFKKQNSTRYRQETATRTPRILRERRRLRPLRPARQDAADAGARPAELTAPRSGGRGVRDHSVGGVVSPEAAPVACPLRLLPRPRVACPLWMHPRVRGGGGSPCPRSSPLIKTPVSWTSPPAP